MSYEPRLIIKYEDLKKIEGELFVEQLSDNTDVERIANFLLDELEDPIKFEDKTFLISKPEFTSFNALVRERLDEGDVYYVKSY